MDSTHGARRPSVWRDDKRWSDKFMPEIKKILGLHLIGEAPIEEDRQRNTDLIVLTMKAVRIGVRVRRANYLNGYCDEFTIRAGRPSGMETELSKILRGWGDYFFYGFGNDDGELLRWTLADLGEFRIQFHRKTVGLGGEIPGIMKMNGDESSAFLCFKWSDFSAPLVVAQSKTETAEA